MHDQPDIAPASVPDDKALDQLLAQPGADMHAAGLLMSADLDRFIEDLPGMDVLLKAINMPPGESSSGPAPVMLPPIPVGYKTRTTYRIPVHLKLALQAEAARRGMRWQSLMDLVLADGVRRFVHQST